MSEFVSKKKSWNVYVITCASCGYRKRIISMNLNVENNVYFCVRCRLKCLNGHTQTVKLLE